MKVIIFGASGETGRSIVKGLLESATQFVCLCSLLSKFKTWTNSSISLLGHYRRVPEDVSQQQEQ